MAFTPKNWQDAPSTATPITAVALEDLEERVTDYTDAQRVSLENSNPLIANDFGVVADGTTDDTAAWEALIDDLLTVDGAAVTWFGNSKIQPGLQFVGRIALMGQSPLRSAFTISGGTDTNNGIIVGGTDGPRYGHVFRDFSILGGAGCCNHALLVQNIIDPDIDLWIKAGADAYGASLEGVMNAKLIRISCTDNTAMAYPGTAPTNGVRVVGSNLLPSNSNRFFFVTEGLDGHGIVGDATVGTAGSFNNALSGTTQANGGSNMLLEGWTDFSVRDTHNEGSTADEFYLEGCQRGTIGSGVFVTGLTHLVDCDDIQLDGLTTTDLTINSACTYTECGRVKINGGTYSNSSLSTFWSGSPLIGETGDIAPSIADGAIHSGGIGVAGATVGMRVDPYFTIAAPQGVMLTAHVSATDVVSYTFYNRTGGTWNSGTGRVRAVVYRGV